MSLINLPYTCVGCDHKFELKKLKKPTIFEITIYKGECPNCNSGFEMRMIKPKVPKFHNHVQTTTVVIKPSEKLLKMLRSGEAKGAARIVAPNSELIGPAPKDITQ